jgi:uncharacterized membrane protein YfcA
VKKGMTLMRVRPGKADGNPAADKSELSGSAARRALLNVREALILSCGLVIGIVTGVLTFFAVHNLALSVLAGGPACAGAIKFLDTVIA